MATFVHITDARVDDKIRRNGIRPARKVSVAGREREMRLRLIGVESVWEREDQAKIARTPRLSGLSEAEYNIRRGYGGAGLIGYLDDTPSPYHDEAIKYRNVMISVRAVYVMPLVPNEQISYGWTREIGHRARQVIAAQIQVPDDEVVYAGFYNGIKHEMTAAEAHAWIRTLPTLDAQRGEVIIPRRIASSEITRISPIRKITGWRYYPTSHGDKPDRYGP